jgi:FtsP/CotA-like multicopper oxidase with cupredoxin domain
VTSTLDEPGTTGPDTDERLDTLEREVRGYRISRDAWTFVIFGIAILTAVASVFAVGLALRDDDEDGGESAAAAASIDAELSEFAITLSAPSIGAGGSIEVTNGGSQVHNLGIRDTELITPDIQPGDTATLDLSSLEPGTYTLYCEIPGHADSGMTTTLVVGGTDQATAVPAAAAGDHGDHAAMTPEEGAALDQRMMDSILAFPAETEGRGNEPLEPEMLADGTKRFELTAAIVDWEVRPGEVVQAWAYNGMVPGPRIDLDVGDRVEVEVTNDLPIGTDVHWHGIDVPNGQDGVAPVTQELIPSGGTYTYNFTVEEPAVSMYHAHAHAQDAVPNGMFGTIFVGEMPLPTGQTVSGQEVPDDIEIAQNIPMVLNDAGVIGLTLDGKSFPATEPIVVNEGDWVQVSYYNEGLQVHPMHLHGFEQIVIAKDGEPLDHPYAADTVLVAPGERYTVIFNANAAGTWVWHCHILNHVESPEGMFGMVTAVVVEAAV